MLLLLDVFKHIFTILCFYYLTFLNTFLLSYVLLLDVFKMSTIQRFYTFIIRCFFFNILVFTN